VEVPVRPSLAAVMIAVPATRPVTKPDVLTVATVEFPLVQVMVRPVSVLLLASRSVALSCTVPFTWTLGADGLTVTVATGAGVVVGVVTVTVAVALRPSLVAVIVAVPAVTPVTRPVALTVALAVLLLDHVMVRPVSTLLLASRSVAVS
jgi:hypothetical protein